MRYDAHSSGEKLPDFGFDALVPCEVVSEPPLCRAPVRRRNIRWVVPLGLFCATCFTTLFAGSMVYENWVSGLQYATAIMLILSCHEMGHYLQARRHGVSASLPFFLPMPIPPFGTIGALIRMDSRIPNRRALYDIGISGPLAGLVPAMICVVVGIYWSEVLPRSTVYPLLGKPPLFSLVGWLFFGSLPRDLVIQMHPLAMAGWVGVFITSLNLLPIGQLDGGHVLYAMVGKRANALARGLLLSIAMAVAIFGLWQWLLMLGILLMMGAKHPPTHDDDAPLHPWRYVLGWCTLLFLFVGFTPYPFAFEDPSEPKTKWPEYVYRTPDDDSLYAMDHRDAPIVELRMASDELADVGQ